MRDDALIYGWPTGTGHNPLHRVDVDDAALMEPWAKRCLVIGVRIDPRNDGFVRVDSDMMQQAGSIPNVKGTA
jgi:hypothetical protein